MDAPRGVKFLQETRQKMEKVMLYKKNLLWGLIPYWTTVSIADAKRSLEMLEVLEAFRSIGRLHIEEEPLECDGITTMRTGE